MSLSTLTLGHLLEDSIIHINDTSQEGIKE